MVSKNNVQVKDRYATKQVPHYGIRKLSVGVASVLLGTTFYMGMNGNVVHADTVNGQNSRTPDSQVANSNTNSESKSGTGANAALGDKHAVVSAAENVVKNEGNTKPQVTEIKNDSHAQSDANAVKPDVDANTQSGAANVKSDVDSNTNARSQNDQNHANATRTMRVMHVASQAGNISPNAVSANLTESTDDTVMQQAIQQTSTLRDDRSTDYAGYIKGQAQSVTLKDGSSLSVNSDVINSDTDQSAILTFKSASFKPGDTYTILIPHTMMQKESDVAHLQPSFGTTTVDKLHLNDGKYYWKIVDRFVNSGTVSQAIKLSRITGLNIDDLNNYFSSADFWRPYDLIHGTINLIKGTDSGSLDFKYQLGSFKERYASYDLANGNLEYPLVNGQAYDFNVYLNTYSVIENGRYDGFGLGKDVLKDVSLSIENDHDYLKLNNSVANIYNDQHQLIGTMSAKADHGKLIFSDLKLNDTVPVIGSLVKSPNGYANLFNITFNATVNVPKQLFNGQPFTFSSAVDDFSFTFNNPKAGVVKPGHPAVNIKVLPDLNSLSTGNLIDYYQSHKHMDLGASDYIDGNKRIYNSTINHDDIPGVWRNSGFAVFPMKLAVNGMTLSDLNYHLDIPDGFDLYSVSLEALDHITSVIIRLKDGTSYKLLLDDLRSHRNSISGLTSVGLNGSYSDLRLDSNSSIASVDIKYHDVDSSFDLGPTSLSNNYQYYQVAPTYASGKPVQVGDLLKFTATLSSTDPRVKIDSAPIVLDDVLITDPNKDTLGVFHAIVNRQSSKTPGVVDAGTLMYEDCNSAYGFPHLKHAVAYLQIPDNASLTDIKKIVVTNGLNGEYGNLTPKSISLVKVANGVTFIKVDLSNYNDVRAGFNISVPYSNIGDLQTSSRPASMLVVSDNFDQNFKGVEHFSSDADSRTDAAVKALIDQENIDVNKTDYQGSTGRYSAWWDILTSDGITSATMTKGNVNSGPSMDSKQDDHGQQADRFDLYGSSINATDQAIPGAVQIINVPDTSDGHSQFNPRLTGPIHVIDANTGKNLDDIAHVTYSQSSAALHSDSLTSVANAIRLTAGQVTDWSKIKSIAIRMDVPKRTSARAVLSMTDPQIYDHIGKTVYVANAIFSIQADSPASEYHLKPVVINAGDPSSAKLTVAGQSTVKTVVHYHDAQGDHYVELPDKAQTYTELQDVMKRSDFLQSDSDLTVADRTLLPAGMVLDYAHPKIKNSNETYLNNYQNGTAAFGKQVKYDFDQDQVIFEGSMSTQTSDTKTVTETIHYVYANGPKAGQKAADDVTKSAEFSRTGFKNPFTGDVQWMKSTSSKTFDVVKSPEIKGYRADQSEIGTQTVTQDSDNIEKTVKYMSQQQKMTINYLDDDAAGKVLHTDSLTGLSNETADYTTANEISTLKGQRYVLVSDDTNGQKPVYDDDVDRDQVFNVHVKHTTHSISDSRTVTETVHYQAADGSQVPSDHLTKANFSRTGTHDEVTGTDHWNAWNISSYDFDAVPTPVKTGYTPDVQTVPAETVTPGSNNIQKVVTYTPDAQKLSVKFIDDTTGQVLKTVAKTGVTNAATGYNTQSDIQSYEGQHYVLVSDSSHGANLVFDSNDSTDQTYEVHFKHGTHQIDEHHTIAQTVHYTTTDHASVPDDHTTSVQFDRDGYHDEVTNADHWNTWKQGGTQTFAEVPTPKKAGYTPDKSSVPATVVRPSDHNQTIDVTYTPDTQKVIVTFIDDTDSGKTLKTVTKTGPTNSSAGYTTGDDINEYKGQHYVLVSDQTHGQNITFDTDTNTDQRYEVHLKHSTHQINDRRTVTETVHYKMTDRTTAPADHTAKVDFSRDGFNDEVTGIDHWNAWTPAATHQFDAVHSPEVKGYTPDTDQITAVTVNPDSQNIDRTVTYSPDVQKLDVTFIDDTTGEALKTVVKNGVTNADANYSTKSDIQNYESQHYVLVSDSSNGAELVFDNDDAVDQHYKVHLKHATHAIDEHHVINETVHYQMSDGTKAPADYQAKALSFSRDGFNDEVTGTDHWNAWTPKAEQTFDKVASPVVAGYTPDLAQINAQTVKPTDHDLEFTVTYTPNVQIAHVKYIDDTDHKVLTQDDLNGRTGETSGYHTADRITEFKGQHYDLVSDNYPAEGMTFDNHDRIDQTYEVHFKHVTRTDEQDVQVPRTIKYVYQNGRPAQPDHTDALKFHETKVVDLVDGHTVSDDWTPAQDFKTIETPVIQGYTPDHASISNIGIVHDHSAIVETVTYNPDAQKAVVKYIDDTTGKQLEAKDLTGVSDQSTGYSTKKTIDGYVNQHYVLVSDGTHGETVVFDHDDDTDQAYEVHLKHGTEPANESRIKKITVHYQYADGLARSGKAADDQTATNLTFKRTGTHDLVTDKIAWNAWDHADQTFSAIDSPAIQGYAPDRTVVDNVKVNPDSHDLTDVTVTYNADSQKLSVDFIDDTTSKTLKTINKIGYSDESADYNTKADVQDFIGKHYDLVSDTTNGANLVFDYDDNINQHYEVHLSHHTHQINEQHTITETVHYQYADGLARSGKAADDFNAASLSFSRDGFNDEVTGVDHWNAWTPAAQQTFAAVQSPVIEGYTPDQSEIGAINIVPTSQSVEKTVTYTADAQKLTVNFIDDVTGQTLKTVAKTGYSDKSAGYNTKSDLQGYLAKHYDLASDATKGADLVFDHDDGTDQVYDVHLTHHLTPISDHQVVNETIHYVYAAGLARTGKAADDYVATPLEFNRTGKHDDVTGTDAWDAWTPGSANFAAVQSPAIQGYAPDQAQINTISVNANSQDIVKTVTYSADLQTVTVDFIDDTDHGKVLKTVTKTGGSDEAVGYNTKADIQTFVDGHYKLDRDTSNGANLVFDHDDAVDQHYEVHLTHETTPITESTSTNQVIHYQLADGTPVTNDYTAKVDFSRDGFKDLVTNADHWNAWTPNATQTFDAVKSPAKAGYTPDHAQVDAVTVGPHHADLETTVTYSPDAQTATVKYIDDTTGKTLQTKELTGVSDETSTYTTASTIKQYVGQHYKLVSDQTNGKPVIFDHDDGSDQTFEVHLTHTYQSVSQEHQVHQTIHYQYADGKQARPDYTAKAIAFSRTGTQDLVTENIQWNAWTPDQVFAAVDTPAANGYTPDVQTTAPVTVSHDSHDIVQTVVYHADDQTILINYIDDDTHSTLKTDSIIGKTAQTSDYTTKKSLDKYKGQHYDVVSDDTNGKTLMFDSDSTKVQTYNVHLKHQHQATNDKSTVRQTVHYIYQDGKQAAKDHVTTPIEFTRTGDTDLVTGQTTWNAWTPATGTFIAVVSPSIEGYTPSRVMIEHVNVHPGDKDLDTTVTYVPNRQVIVVNYIDQTTGKTLKTDTLNGHSDQTSGYTTKSQIDSYVGQHYKLISDDTKGRTLTFDHDDQATQTYDVVLGHQTEAAHRTHEVHETVDYVYADGSQAAKSFTAQPLVFSQTGVHDLVTNTTDWNSEWTKPQTFAAVESPKITGFTASKPEVKAVEVTHQSGDVHELVIYAANAQTAQIKYIDDVTGKTLETDGANGHFNESIVFGHNVTDQINKFKQAHYKLVSNNFAGQKYQADNTKNVYEVHLTHERQNVHATDTVTETVKFQYADGSQAQPTKTQKVNFGRDGIKDLVTGTIAWMPVDPQTVGAVNVPAIDGYTADTDQVLAVKVHFGDDDITKVVTYIANDQTAGIKIIDDTTGKVLNTQSATGKFGTEIQFKQNPDQQVIDLQAQHYELVSDNFKHQAYKSDNAQNQFEIHVRHQTVDTQRTDAVTETVHYRDNHGNQLRPDTQVTKTFTQSGVIDKVTGDIAWNPVASQTIDSVTAPEITGYTPDRNSVPAVTVNFGDNDLDQTIVYTPVQEPASIKYIDDTTGKTLLTDHTTGDFGTQINFDHDPIAQIGQYESQGYKLVSNSYGNNAHQFSATASDNNFEVHLTHGTKDVVRTSTVNRIINYVDSATGEKLRPSTTQTLTFTEHGVLDEVTGETTWTDVPVQHFAKIATPEIEGYTTEVQTVDSVAAHFSDADLEVNVPYTKVAVPETPKTPGTPDQPGTPGTPSTPEQPSTPSEPGTPQLPERPAAPTARQANHAQSAANNTATVTELPQTGDDSQHSATLVGLGLIGMMGALFGFKKKREHKN